VEIVVNLQYDVTQCHTAQSSLSAWIFTAVVCVTSGTAGCNIWIICKLLSSHPSRVPVKHQDKTNFKNRNYSNYLRNDIKYQYKTTQWVRFGYVSTVLL